MVEGAIPMLGEESWATLKVMNTLAKLYTAQGRYDKAEKTFRNVLGAGRRIWGANHSEIPVAMNNLGILYTVQGRCDLARRLLAEGLEGR